jgi:phosphate transport system permease protein
VLRTDPKRRRRRRAARWFFRPRRSTTFVVTLLIIGTLVVDAWDFLVQARPDRRRSRLAERHRLVPSAGMFDISTLVVGTFIVTGIAMLVAVPLGLGAAVYLSEYARPRVRRVVKPIIEVLAGVPSVVLGYFAIAFINPTIIVNLFTAPTRRSPSPRPASPSAS